MLRRNPFALAVVALALCAVGGSADDGNLLAKQIPAIYKNIDPRFQSVAPSARALLQAVTCPTGNVPCVNTCMPQGSVCCTDGSGYCPANYVCVSGSSSCRATCAAGQVACGNGCMPSGATCCGSQSGSNYFCENGKKCTNDNPPKCAASAIGAHATTISITLLLAVLVLSLL